MEIPINIAAKYSRETNKFESIPHITYGISFPVWIVAFPIYCKKDKDPISPTFAQHAIQVVAIRKTNTAGYIQ
jgi:hypothetical protein